MKNFRKEYHEEYLKVRSCNYIVQSDEFEELFKILSLDEQREFIRILYTFNKDKIKKYIHLKRDLPYKDMPIRRLRQYGKNLKIENYHKLPKSELVKDIENVIERLEESIK